MKSMYDVNLNEKTVLVRIDLNTTIKNGKPLINERFVEHSKTIKELIKMNAKIILIAHQGRPGEKDFISLHHHAKVLSKLVGRKIKFIPGLYEKKVVESIKFMKPKDVILLENVRFYDDEFSKNPRRTKFVKTLQPLIDYFILDAFSVAHRAQTSVIGFHPAIAGRVLLNELSGIEKIKHSKHPYMLIVGGGKIKEPLNLIHSLLKNGTADLILTGGVTALILMKSEGFDIDVEAKDDLINKSLADKLMSRYEDKIVLPLDLIDKNGESHPVYDLPHTKFYDIGNDTIKLYKEKIKSAKTILLSKPLGVYEKKKFENGTKKVFRAVSNCRAKKFAGGGDTVTALKKFKISLKKFDYVSLAGGAFLDFISGKKLPGLKVIKYSNCKD